MPKLNARGDVLMGVGGHQGSVNQQPYPFATFGRGAFEDDDTVIVSLSPSGMLARWPLGSGASPVELVPPRGANVVSGGGGKYLALAVPVSGPVLFGSIPDRPGAGAPDVALDGTMAFVTDYGTGMGVTLIPLSGGEVSVPGVWGFDVRAQVGGGVVWRGGAAGCPVPRPYHADAMNLKIAIAPDGTRWLCYWSNALPGLVLHIDGEDAGYILETRDTAFDHDLVPWGAGGVLLAWSLTAGEAPGDLVMLSASRTGVQFVVNPERRDPPVWQSFVTAPPDPEPPDPEPEPEPEPPDPEPAPEPPDGEVDMTPQQVAIRGAAGKFARIDPGERGHGLFGGYPIHFDADTVGEHERFELSKPDDKYQITHLATGEILGADATDHAADLCQQFYTSGGDVTERGPYESWTVFRLTSGGTICALIEYDQDGRIYTSADVNLEEL